MSRSARSSLNPVYSSHFNSALTQISLSVKTAAKISLLRVLSADLFGLMLTISIGQTNAMSVTGVPLRIGNYRNDTSRSVKSIKWQFKTGGVIRAVPSLSNGKIYIGSGDGFFYSINERDGKVIWKHKIGNPVYSSAAIKSETLFFTSNDNTLYALNIKTGKMVWKFRMGKSLPYTWSCDYYTSSPTVYNNSVFAGSGNGHMYAVNINTGKQEWNFDAHGIIHSSPAIAHGLLYFGDFSGKLYALNIGTGKKMWEYGTIGATYDNNQWGYERRAIIARPVISGNYLIVGGKDGLLYCLDAISGEKKWTHDFNTSWVISTVAIKDSVVVCGSSVAQLFIAFNINTGKELWERGASTLVFGSPIITGNTVIDNDDDGILYFFDLKTGIEDARYKIAADQIYSSPILSKGVIFIGCDDGNLYALNTSRYATSAIPNILKAVYWQKDAIHDIANYIESDDYGLDGYVKDYFNRNLGYSLVDDTTLRGFFLQRIKDTLPSVVVFATNYFPLTVYDTLNNNNLLMQYLRSGGKIVTVGPNPANFFVDYKSKLVMGEDFDLSDKIMGIKYPKNGYYGGYYPTKITQDGIKWGIKNSGTGFKGIAKTDGMTVLKESETGDASWWVKQYSKRKGSGFVQLLLTHPDPANLSDIKRIAEYGLY